MNPHYIKTGAIFAGLAVLLGAFGAHTLREQLAPDQLQVFETGVRYQFYHSLAIILCGVLAGKFNVRPSVLLFSGGIILFSFSLYLLSCRQLLGIDSWSWLGPVTPIGGLLFISGWGMMVVNVKMRK
jgi:uncharacterized membrane protein YgdD (TMEM256/DUF423 family)